ncbi:helix-turn-helix domain-containing protein [Flexibacterium corallicola]|uniref:helix-turn-helix domain-containing protein n=1 Tax=Flexibacterium corallicola TaxID=3037259 RepID=UPI00286F8C0A|nr:AraC family transcriptional regulator [Pseudovibrio sp. M1P-2-3]
MPSLPLPFFTALLLGVVLLRLNMGGGKKVPLLLGVTIGFYALQSVLLGLRWGGFPLPPVMLGMFAVCIPTLTLLCLKDLTGNLSTRFMANALQLTLFAALCQLASFKGALLWLGDGLGILAYLGIGVYLWQRAQSSRMEWAEKLPFGRAVPCRQAHFVAAGSLIASGLVDVLVALELAYNSGARAGQIVGAANLLFLFGALALYLFLSYDTGKEEPQILAGSEAVSDDEKVQRAALVAAFDRLMVEEEMYRQETLSLSVMAKHLKVPARQLSEAINAERAMSVPQYVNRYRIEDACQRLGNSSATITQIMYDVGFTTKSNFNREFTRVTGMSPSAWRKHVGENGPRVFEEVAGNRLLEREA